MTDIEDERDLEVELLLSMLDTSEIRRPDPDHHYAFEIDIPSMIEPSSTGDSTAVDYPSESVFRLYTDMIPGYPAVLLIPEITVESSDNSVKKAQMEELRKDLFAFLQAEEDDQMKVVAAVNWIRQEGGRYYLMGVQKAAANQGTTNPSSNAQTGVPTSGTLSSGVPTSGTSGSTADAPKGFMREWVSFPCFYKDSYISGPNRFELMLDLARGRNLNITGRGIAGKPGGMVCEGLEENVEKFMDLMRTEWLETWNPRGRKITTRLQERFPYDREEDTYEVAAIFVKSLGLNVAAAATEKSAGLAENVKTENAATVAKCRSSLVKISAGARFVDDLLSNNLVKTRSDAEFVEKYKNKFPGYWGLYFLGQQNFSGNSGKKAWQQQDWEDETAWDNNQGEGKSSEKSTFLDIYERGHPRDSGSVNTMLAKMSTSELEGQRLFKDFTIITEEDGGYREGARMLKEIGAVEGMDAMFTYRFS